MGIFEPKPRRQGSRIGAAERDPLGVGEIVLHVHGRDKVCEVGEGLLRGEVHQVLDTQVGSGMAVTVESEL